MLLKNTLAYMSDFCNFFENYILNFEEEWPFSAQVGDQDTAETFC
jgi:hypothetical protein